jgi:hypothetical protein
VVKIWVEKYWFNFEKDCPEISDVTIDWLDSIILLLYFAFIIIIFFNYYLLCSSVLLQFVALSTSFIYYSFITSLFL